MVKKILLASMIISSYLAAMEVVEDKKAQAQLLFDEGVTQYEQNNLSKAKELYKKSADLGHMLAASNLSFLLLDESRKCADKQQKIDLLNEGLGHAARALPSLTLGPVNNFAAISIDLAELTGDPRFAHLGLELLRVLAEEHPTSFIYRNLINAYLGMSKKESEPHKQLLLLNHAIKISKLAVVQGQAEAQCTMGEVYRAKSEASKNTAIKQKCLRKALNWYKKAAEQDSTDGQNFTGGCYGTLASLTKDQKEKTELVDNAILWYTKAADKGDQRSQYNLGVIYRERSESCTDALEKEKLFEKALAYHILSAQQGLTVAQHDLGLLYYNQSKIAQPKSLKKERVESAITWFTKAAEAGHREAQYILATIYCVKTNTCKPHKRRELLQKGEKWARLSAEQGCESSKRLLDQIVRDKDFVQEKPTIEKSCAFCKAANAGFKCACKSVNYCNAQCQKNHWQEHRKNCAWKK